VGIRNRRSEARSGEKPAVRSSVKVANDNFQDNLIDRARKVWRPRLGRDLSDDEAKQIATNVTGFFAILSEWSRADLREPANDNGDRTTSHDKGVRDDS